MQKPIISKVQYIGTWQMKPHSAVTKLPRKIPVSTSCSVVLKGAGCTLLKLGELESHLSYGFISFGFVIYRNVFGHKKHTVPKTPLAGHAWCHGGIHLLLLEMSILAASIVSRETWGPSKMIPPCLEMAAEPSPCSFYLAMDLSWRWAS